MVGEARVAWIRCERCWNYDAGDCIEGPCVDCRRIGLKSSCDERGATHPAFVERAITEWNIWVAQGMPQRRNLGHPWPWKDEGITMVEWLTPRLKLWANKQNHER